MVSGLFDVRTSEFETLSHVAAALSKPTSALTVLEQSYLHSEYPARLPSVAKGIESVRQLQKTLLETVNKAIVPAAFYNLQAVSDKLCVATSIRERSNLCTFQTVALIGDILSCLAELLVLFGLSTLNYTVYQALLSEIRRCLNVAVVPDFLVLQCRELSMAINAAEDSVKRSTGHHLEAIWEYTQRATSPLLDALSGTDHCDIVALPVGERLAPLVVCGTGLYR